MNSKSLIVVTCLLLPVPVAAQAGPEVVQSAEELTCKLTGDCDAFNQELATLDAVENRGFSVRLPGKSAAATDSTNRIASNRPSVAGRYSSAPGGRDVAVAVTRERSILQRRSRTPTATQVGRASMAIGFASGSDVFTDSGLAQARNVLEAIRKPSFTGKRLLVAGHTDSVGTRERNLELSRRRADALVKYLVQNGVEPTRLDAKGFGLDQPISGLSPRNGANRRVELVVIN